MKVVAFIEGKLDVPPLLTNTSNGHEYGNTQKNFRKLKCIECWMHWNRNAWFDSVTDTEIPESNIPDELKLYISML